MIAILVPVLERAHQIEPLLANIHDTTHHEHRVLFICSPADDARKVCQATDAHTIVAEWHPGRADYAKKLALGYQHTTEPWIFQGATDLLFHANWDLAAINAATRHNKLVVGTNDLHNPLVKRGQHSTHTLIHRDYIEHYGGTNDNSGTIFSEAYDHQWTDVEFVETALRRKQFVFAKHSVVEHLHYHWGLAPKDTTYEKATRLTKQDQRLFHHRRTISVRAKP